MILSKKRYVAGALFVAILLAGSAHAQRRVFTNDDVATTPLPAAAPPAPAAPAGTAAQPARAEPAPGTPMSAAEAEWRQAMQLQSNLNAVYEALDMIVQKETNPQRQPQWTAMINCISSLLQTNQARVRELFAQLPPEQQAQERQQFEQEQSEQANPPSGEGSQPAAPPPPR